MSTLPIFGPPPARILCQSKEGSCAACCGLYNFLDRSPDAQERRLQRRTHAVQAAWASTESKEEALAAIRDALLEEEAPQLLSDVVKVCPFAGYIESGRVGCMIHPSRHPEQKDLRHLAVYPREVCAGHFCAPHDWLRPREVALGQCAQGTGYGRIITDAGLIKAISELIDDALGRRYKEADVEAARPQVGALWQALLQWPYADPDPRRFGGFYLEPSGVERTMESGLAAVGVAANRAVHTVLDALGSRFEHAEQATKSVALLRTLVEKIVQEMR